MSIEHRGCIEQSFTVTEDSKSARRTEVFLCTDGEPLSNVLEHSGLPVIGDPFPGVSGVYCSNIVLKPERDGRKVKVLAECTYKSAVGGIVHSGESVYGKAFHFRVSPVETKVPFLYSYDRVDSSGNPVNPVCTTAGEFFDLETTAVTMLLRFSYYIRTFEPEWILNLTDTTNKRDMRICGLLIKEECGLLRSISAETAEVQNRSVIQVNAEIEVNPAGFLRKVQNRGYFSLYASNLCRVCYGISKVSEALFYAPLTEMLEKRMENTPIMPVDEPVWLDADGKAVNWQRASQNSLMLSFREKKSADWSVLSMPAGKPW